MADPLQWLAPSLAELEAAGLRRTVRHRDRRWSVGGAIDVSGNDYLGLARDPRLARAAAQAAEAWGPGAGASRLVVGGSIVHAELEQAIARWKGTDDALVFSSGYLANTGTIAALVGPGDLICSDELNHASIIDGCRLSGASLAVYRHNDAGHLGALLEERAATARRILVVTDGIFSMDGDAADLPALCDVAEAYEAMVMVDDAHGSGVIGPDGRGTAAAQGVSHRVHVHLGTLSKAVGAAGGFVAGSHDLVDWLRNRARSFVFDTAMPPGVAAAALEGVRIASTDERRRTAAVARAAQLAQALELPAPAACVVPLIVGEPQAAMAVSTTLEEAGFLAIAIRPPSVPAGTARIRFSVSAAHDEATITRLAEATMRARVLP